MSKTVMETINEVRRQIKAAEADAEGLDIECTWDAGEVWGIITQIENAYHKERIKQLHQFVALVSGLRKIIEAPLSCLTNLDLCKDGRICEDCPGSSHYIARDAIKTMQDLENEGGSK